MSDYWFRPRDFGYGATPTTWQGWAVSAAYAAIVFGCVVVLLWTEPAASAWAATLTVLLVATVLLIYVSWLKTDGRWQWHWGQNSRRKTR